MLNLPLYTILGIFLISAGQLITIPLENESGKTVDQLLEANIRDPAENHPKLSEFIDQTATSQNPIRNTAQDATLEVVGKWVFGPCYAVTTVGDVAYFDDGVVLNIMDFSDPVDPALLARVGLPGLEIHDVCVAGPHAYVANNEAGLRVIDVSE